MSDEDRANDDIIDALIYALSEEEEMIDDKRQLIVCCGNPFDGFAFAGPFDSHNEALAWAERHCTDSYWVSEIEPPVAPEVRFKWRNINTEE